MPPKMKLHKEKGKLKSIPRDTPGSSQNTAPVPLESDSESRQQFEVELLWCIHQLQNALESGKLSQKQMQDSSKTLNTLMSNRTPLIRKRQLMRGTFGDYRTKMAEEERKYARINSKICLAPVKPSKKSVFVKKAPFLTSGKDFKFNFTEPKPIEQLENTTETLAQLNLQEKPSDAIIELVTVSEIDSKKNDTKSESTESAQKRKTECVENNGTVQDRSEENEGKNDEPPCKMFHYHKSQNEFRFNFTETTAE